MASITKAISPVPTGGVRLDLYASTGPNGPWVLLVQIAVVEGQESITFDATANYFYQFRIVDGTGVESEFSSVWQYTIDDSTCIVSGICVGAMNVPIEGVTVTATLLAQTHVTNRNRQIAGSAVCETGVDGRWNLALVKTDLLTDPYAKYVITFTGEGFNEVKTVTVPEVDFIDYEDLPIAGSLTSDFDIGFLLDTDNANWFIGEKKYITFTVTEGSGNLTTLPDCTAYVRLRRIDIDDDGITKVYSNIFDWDEAELDSMTIRYLLDSKEQVGSPAHDIIDDPTSGSVKYVVDAKLLGPVLGEDGMGVSIREVVYSKPFPMRFK